MREIKFRAWHKKCNFMEPVMEICFGKKDDGEPEWRYAGMQRVTTLPSADGGGYKPADYDAEEIVLMQFTGLKDKNEKEIYEGDIVIDHAFDSHPELSKHEVQWDERACRFTLDPKSNEHFGLCKFAEWHYEVIGNIYENPDILKPTESEAR